MAKYDIRRRLEEADAFASLMQAGAACYEKGEFEEALVAFSKAMDLQPDRDSARYNLAVVNRTLEQNANARSLFESLLDSPQFFADVRNNLGILASRREEWDLAERHFRAAIATKNQFPLAHFNLGTLLLRQGRFEEGWREYEWRWQTPSFTPIEIPQPQWDGQPLDGTLLLHTEQGIGDTFQFARFIPKIRERCKRLIFVRPETLDCMFPADRWADETLGPGEIPLEEFQAYLPLMSGARVLHVGLDNLPGVAGYLTPVDRTIDLGECHVPAAKLKVGIVWGGSTSQSSDAYRSATLDQFVPLFQIPQIAFYSLQKGPQTSDLDQLGEYAPVVRDLNSLQNDFADTAAIVRQLDLVISVDTSVLHLVGGMLLPVWGLLSTRSDWRWLGDDREESPWYPTLRLFRQKSLNGWNELMNRVAAVLRQYRDQKAVT